MKFNKWTLALATLGVVSLGSVAQAEEAKNQVLTAVSSTTLSGYVDTSAIWQFGPRSTSVGRSYDGADKQDGFNLNVVKLSVAKGLDEGEWSAGYQADLLFGPDANTFRGALGYGEPGDFAIQQAYVNTRIPVGNGLNAKIGVFDSVVGYESFDSYKNPNYSRSFGYSIEPRQNTGILLDYQVAEWMNIAGGVANTYNSPINVRDRYQSSKAYLGSVTFTAPESMGFLKGASLYAGVESGYNSVVSTSSPGNVADTTSWYAGVYIPTPLEGLGVGAAYDYRGQEANNNAGYQNASYANALAGYVSFQATEKMKLNNRLEYATGTMNTWSLFATRHEQYLADTFTLDYNLWQNVVTRGEVRWDHDLTHQGLVGDRVWGQNGRNNAFSLALNVIYKF